MDSWALFFVFALALSAGLTFRAARGGRGFGTSLDHCLPGYVLYAAGAVYMAGADELGLALIAIISGLPLFGAAALLGFVAGRIASRT